jgi:hypothetical protein
MCASARLHIAIGGKGLRRPQLPELVDLLGLDGEAALRARVSALSDDRVLLFIEWVAKQSDLEDEEVLRILREEAEKRGLV